MHNKVERLREDLCNRYDFNVLEAFRTIDVYHNRAITPQNLQLFFKKNKFTPTDDKILALITRLDKKACGYVCYMDFMESILPVQSNTKNRPNYAMPTKGFLSRVSGNLQKMSGKFIHKFGNTSKSPSRSRGSGMRSKSTTAKKTRQKATQISPDAKKHTFPSKHKTESPTKSGQRPQTVSNYKAYHSYDKTMNSEEHKTLSKAASPQRHQNDIKSLESPPRSRLLGESLSSIHNKTEAKDTFTENKEHSYQYSPPRLNTRPLLGINTNSLFYFFLI